MDPLSIRQEARRLETLRSYAMLDTSNEEEFDDLVVLAAQICQTPIALISLVDEDRQWFKAAFGLDLKETSREISFCDHALRQTGVFVVPDATLHPDFSNNPLVVREPRIRFYAGAPLVAPDGQPLGTLCVIDREARVLTKAQERALSVLSRHVMAQFELRRQAHATNRVNRALLSLLEDERIAETAVRKSEELNRGVLDSMLAQIAVLDRNGKIIAVNDAWRRFAAERIGDKPESLSRTHVGSIYLDIWRSSFDVIESEAITVREGLRSLLRGERSSFTLEYSCRARDEKRWFLLSATPLKTEDGGAAVSHLDITERLAMEEQLRQSHRLDAIGQLTGGVAHDFNNMLTVILGNAELLQEGLERDVAHRELAEMIVGAANSAAELTKRLLAFARKQALNPIAVDSNQLITDMYPLLRRTLAANLEFEMVAESDVWQALVDPAQLENAVLNLCINARDAMLGGGRLRIETKNVELDEDYAAGHVDVKSGQYVSITVTDTGCGIAPDVLRRVFEPFFTTKDKGKGTGLGLAMVYGFIKQSDGHISIFSEPGQGTTVRMYLPRAVGDSPHAAVATGAFRIIHGTETILLVEDDEQVRRFALSQLKSLGYNVLQAQNGVEAMELIERNERIDLLFTDVVMPGMSGRQLADSARRRRPGLRVLFTSGYNEDAIVHHGRLDHGVQLLPKPYRRRELAKRIRSIFDAPC
jgi:signal transduction histidine kinase